MTRRRNIQRLKDDDRTIDASRGSTAWSYNHYRSRMLTSLLNDLIDRENEGIEPEICDQIQKSLDYFINASTEISSGGFLTGNLYSEVESFKEIYVNWNDVQGMSEVATRERRRLLVSLRRQRQKITNKARSLQFELANDLDRQILADTYRAIGELINLAPDLFKNLSSALADYSRRGGF